MGNSNRSALIGKAHRVLKQHYTPVATPERPVLEHLLFGCCLENAPYDVAEKVFEQLTKHFFDWNEVRVSTVMELAEAMRPLPDPQMAGSNIKRVLQGVFESSYSFELESLRKQSIGQGSKLLEKLGGASAFNVSYVTQAALGGHVIPLDRGALEVLAIIGVITPAEAASGKVSGLERAIPKNKGEEFASLLHQIGADFISNPHSPTVRKLLLSINPDGKDRFPKRGAKKEPEPPPEPVGKKKQSGEPIADKAKPKPDSAAHAKPARGESHDKHGKPPAEKAPMEKGPDKSHSDKAHAEKGHADKGHADKAHTDKSHDKHAGKAAEKHAEKQTEKHAEKQADLKDRAKAKPDAAAKHEKVEKHDKAAKHPKSPPPDKRKAHSASHKPLPAARPHAVTTKRKSSTKQLAKRKPR